MGVTVDEGTLLAASRRGDLTAYDELVGAYQDRVYQLTYRVTGNPEDAWDAAQEAFVKAFRALKAFRGDAAFSTWLHRIAVNAALDIIRRRPPALDPLDAAAAVTTESVDRMVEQRELQRAIHRAIASLPPDQRVAVVLRDVQGFSYGEIAAVLQVPVGTVRSRLSRARDALRHALADLSPARAHSDEQSEWR
ncbi:MAG TPA: sigma-70 family RNA polymerase sigma factor [bacterium]|nr:sigma-70 family RNA polymerase sigma factor [bacterium]